MLKILFAFMVVALACAMWQLSDTLGLPSWAAPWAMVAALTVSVLLLALELLQRRGSRLRDKRKRDDASTLHQKIRTLQERCDHSIRALREQSAGDLPWVLLVGPTGAGKTSALRGSGVSFRSGFGPERFISGGDVPPTEDVQFFASEQVVFVDTSGRYLSEATDTDDRREWLALLGLLRAQRPGRPVAGVVLTLGAGALATSTTDGAAHLGVSLRRQIDDIQREFAASIPVYLLVSRIDEIAGLTRVLADDPSDRLGFKVALSGAGAHSAKRVAESPLGELGLALERRAFVRLKQVATPEERGEVYRAPGHFRRLTAQVTAVIERLFPDHGSAEAPIWRGLYFATAGHAGAGLGTLTADLELDQIARDYGDPPQQTNVAPTPLARPAFLRGLIAVELPADRWIASETRRRRSQQHARHILHAALFAATAGAWLSFALGAARENLDLLGAVHESVSMLEASVPLDRPLLPTELRPIQTVTHLLRDHQERGVPWSLRAGLYQGGALVEPAEHAYQTLARDRLLVPLVQSASQRLARLLSQHKEGTTAVSPDSYWPAVDDLHLYLLLTRATTGKVTLQAADQRQWAEERLPGAWAEMSGFSERSVREARAFIHDYLAELVERPSDLVERDEALVVGVRQILARSSRGQMWADELAKVTIPGAQPISVSSITSAGWLTSKENLHVEAAYTLKGWDYVRDRIRCPAALNERYLAAALTIDERDCADERTALHGQYFKRYVESWTRFLNDVYVREPDGFKDIEAQIVDMTAPGGAGVNTLENLFRIVGENAHLSMASDSDLTATPEEFIPAVLALARRQTRLKGIDFNGSPAASGDTVTVATVRDAFKPYYSYGYSPPGAEAGAAALPLQNYILTLAKVAHPLGLYTKESNQEALTQAKTIASQVYELVHNEHFTQRDRRWTPALEGILDPPVRGLLDEINSGNLGELTTRWCSEIVAPFDQMRICYPFSRTTCGVSGDEVTNLFHPQKGKIWVLYGDKLSHYFPFRVDRYVAASQGYNSRLKLDPEVATFLTNARELGEVLFPGGAAAPSFAFGVQFKTFKSASRLTLTVDGASVSYNNSELNAFQRLTWPGTLGAPGARLLANIQSGDTVLTDTGYWGLFRLLERGDVERQGRLLIAKLRFTGHKEDVELRLDPQDSTGNPLLGKLRTLPMPEAGQDIGLMDIFREERLSPPRRLFGGGMTCPPPAAPPSVPSPP